MGEGSKGCGAWIKRREILILPSSEENAIRLQSRSDCNCESTEGQSFADATNWKNLQDASVGCAGSLASCKDQLGHQNNQTHQEEEAVAE